MRGELCASDNGDFTIYESGGTPVNAYACTDHTHNDPPLGFSLIAKCLAVIHDVVDVAHHP